MSSITRNPITVKKQFANAKIPSHLINGVRHYFDRLYVSTTQSGKVIHTSVITNNIEGYGEITEKHEMFDYLVKKYKMNIY